ncbi:hypothetical protein YerA41_039 [Yersinia phage YerA41]|uniref:Uncharacterized protein n=1 Tax=Yersinia phage vB_Yru_GN1 TaxID=3074381 RepID=A0AA86MGV6_9CAUD|nr:hypothetical protein YerA41_039 [Yersinia phage YerA41]BES79855.1 hypothetical protein [Yersinia phage vB_Yru_GN1]
MSTFINKTLIKNPRKSTVRINPQFPTRQDGSVIRLSMVAFSVRFLIRKNREDAKPYILGN